MKKPSKLAETEDVSRVDYLLNLLSDLSPQDPSPSLRERLSALAVHRLQENVGSSVRFRGIGLWQKAWFKPALAFAFLTVVALTTMFLFHWRSQDRAQADRTVEQRLPATAPEYKAKLASAGHPIVAIRKRVHHLQSAAVRPGGAQRMTLRLPYSNSAIETGANTTIRVSVSQSELLSLGFPISATIQDQRVVAELTLGDDGLPRAISVPLPLEVLKEKK